MSDERWFPDATRPVRGLGPAAGAGEEGGGTVTEQEVMALTGRELDAAVYCVLVSGEDYPPKEPFFPNWKDGLPNYHCNHYQVALDVEAEIGRRGLTAEYVDALCHVLDIAPEWVNDEVWAVLTRESIYRLLTAAPEARCRAALLAAREAVPPRVG